MADAVNVQYQVRRNNEELQDYLKDLYRWEDEVKAKEKLLLNTKASKDMVILVKKKMSSLVCLLTLTLSVFL